MIQRGQALRPAGLAACNFVAMRSVSLIDLYRMSAFAKCFTNDARIQMMQWYHRVSFSGFVRDPGQQLERPWIFVSGGPLGRHSSQDHKITISVLVHMADQLAIYIMPLSTISCDVK